MNKQYSLTYKYCDYEDRYKNIVECLKQFKLIEPNLPEKIHNMFGTLDSNVLRGNTKIGATKGAVATDFNEINDISYVMTEYTNYDTQQPELKNYKFKRTFIAKNGYDMYMSDTAGSNYGDKKCWYPGLYHKDLRTGVITYLYGSRPGYTNFFESFDDELYITGAYDSYESCPGVLYVQGKNVTVLSPGDTGLDIFYQDLRGNIYVTGSKNNATRAMFLLEPTKMTTVLPGHYRFFEANGQTYAYCTYNNATGYKGFVRLNGANYITLHNTAPNTTTVTIAITEENVYLGSSNVAICLDLLTDDVYTLSSSLKLSVFVYNGVNVYASSSSSSYKGLYIMNRETPVLIDSTSNLYNMGCLINNADGKTYISSSGSVAGFYRIDGNAITTISSTGYGYTNLFKDKYNRTFITSSKSNTYYIIMDSSGVHVSTKTIQSGTDGCFNLKGINATYIYKKIVKDSDTTICYYIPNNEVDYTYNSSSGILIKDEKWDYFYIWNSSYLYYVYENVAKSLSVSNSSFPYYYIIPDTNYILFSSDKIYPAYLVQKDIRADVNTDYYKLTGELK